MGGIFSSRRRRNPTEDRLQRLRKEQDRAAAAKAERQKAEENRARAEEKARRAREESQRLEEERIRIQEQLQRAREEALRAEENMKRLQEVEEARNRAEQMAQKAHNEKVQADEERRRAEQEKQMAEESRRIAEQEQRKAEEGLARMNQERLRADEEAAQARLMQEKAELGRQEADREAACARVALEEAQKRLREGNKPIIIPTEEQVKATKERLNYKEGYFHFAIAGVSGSGKSSLINAFRGMRNNSKDPSRAMVGVTETTSTVTRYPDPDDAKPIVWYDIPGAGTLDIPDYEYFNDQGLYVFDCIIVLVDNRFMATDKAILKNCERFNIPAYIVRSKSKQHVQNLKDDLDNDDDEGEDELVERARSRYIQETRASVAKNLEVAQLAPQQVYLVDKEAMVEVVKGKQVKKFIDELKLFKDLLSEAQIRRSLPVTKST